MLSQLDRDWFAICCIATGEVWLVEKFDQQELVQIICSSGQIKESSGQCGTNRDLYLISNRTEEGLYLVTRGSFPFRQTGPGMPLDVHSSLKDSKVS